MKYIAKMLLAVLSLTLAFATTSKANELKGWQRQVVQELLKKQVYPRSAIAQEIEGRAKVRLEVSQDGTILDHQIVENTGQEVLDKEIPKLVKRLNPLPTLPALPDGRTKISFVMPLTWSLN